MASDDIQPFKISISDSALDDLKTRLNNAKFPNELDAASWDYGAPLADVQRLTKYWRDTFSWRTAETALNKLPHYTTTLQCTDHATFEPLTIHFLHSPSPRPNAIPLLFIHGWPGSFLEGTKIIHPLSHPTTPSQPAFNVVIPSLPNYTFSSGSKKRGFAIAQYAETCHKLMLKLGYPEYVTQGGDWGYYVSRCISLLYPQSCKATHLNFDQGAAPTFASQPLAAARHALTPFTEAEKKGFERSDWFLKEGSAYRTLQMTKPQTLGYALSDSPVALLAWVYEKLHDWTDGYPWTDEEVCTWVSLYWFSVEGAAASVRIYYEATHPSEEVLRLGTTRDRLTQWIGGGVKVGLTHSPMDLRVLPSSWTRTQGEVVFENNWDSGGHFFAWEEPEHLLQDVRGMFGKNGGAAGVVKGRHGYE